MTLGITIILDAQLSGPSDFLTHIGLKLLPVVGGCGARGHRIYLLILGNCQE